jgi:hypothetical protein
VPIPLSRFRGPVWLEARQGNGEYSSVGRWTCQNWWSGITSAERYRFADWGRWGYHMGFRTLRPILDQLHVYVSFAGSDDHLFQGGVEG